MIEIVAATIGWALSATVLAMIPALPLAFVLARRDFPGKTVLLAAGSLPMVLPPTAVGYLLLRSLSDNGPWAPLTAHLDILFTGKAVVLACTVMAFPLVLRTAKVAFEKVDPRLESMAATLGYDPLRSFFKVTLPMASNGIIAAAILGFTRAVGEFGATVMVAGIIPGRTQTLSSAIYSAQQAGDYDRSDALLFIAVVIGFLAVLVSEKLTRIQPRHGRT